MPTMCFSLEADLIAGAVLVPIGVLALCEVREAREIPFAALPILFAAHQLVESLVWAGDNGAVSTGLAHAAAVAYVIFALPVLPTLMPIAVLLLEPPGRRARVAAFVALGVAVSAYLSSSMIRHGVTATIRPHSISYDVGLSNAVLWTGLYIVAVVGASLLSGYRTIVAFGVLNLVGLTAVGLVYREAFASVWCVYAALTSLLILLHLYRRHELLGRPRDRGQAVSASA